MDKIAEILKQMTLEDKISLCTGQDFWRTKSFEGYGIPSAYLCDGPLGLRRQTDASARPSRRRRGSSAWISCSPPP